MLNNFQGQWGPFQAPRRSNGGGPVLGPGAGQPQMGGLGGGMDMFNPNPTQSSPYPPGSIASPPRMPGKPQPGGVQGGPAWQPQGPSNNAPKGGPAQAGQPLFGQWYNNQVMPFGQMGQQGPASQFGYGVGNVTGSITPTGVYTPEMTNAAANQAEAEAMRASSLPGLLKQLDRNGVSRSAGSVAAVMPQMAQYQQQGAYDANQIRASDEVANRQSMLNGQIAQDQEGLGLMSLLRQLYGINQSQDTRNLNLGASLLGGFF